MSFPNYELITKGGISLGTNFELLGEKPLDSRLVVPSLEGLEHLIDNAAAYAGMIVYVSSECKHYQVNADKSYREFGISADELKDLIASETTAAMEFKGATASLPAVGVKGDMYKVSASFEVAAENDAQGVGFTTKIGDSIVCNVMPTEEGAEDIKWYLIPSGDDIEDTWRPITNVANDATITFAAGANLDVEVKADGTVTYSHETIAAPTATAETEVVRTYITSVETDGHGHITGYKTATENVEDTNTTYEFECQTGEEHTNVFFKVKASDADQEQEVCLDAYTQKEVDDNINAAVKVVTDAIATDREVWDLAETAVQNDTFELYQEEVATNIETSISTALEGLNANVTFLDEEGTTITNITSDKTDVSGDLEVRGNITVTKANDPESTHIDNYGLEIYSDEYGTTTNYRNFGITYQYWHQDEDGSGAQRTATLSFPEKTGVLATQDDITNNISTVNTEIAKKLDNANGTISTSTNENGDATELNINDSVILAASHENGYIRLGADAEKATIIDQTSIAGINYSEILTTADADGINNRIDEVQEIAEAALPEYSADYSNRAYWGNCGGNEGLVVAYASSAESTHDSSMCTVISEEAITFHEGSNETYVAYSHAGIKTMSGETLSFPELSGCIVVDSQLEDLSSDVSESIEQVAKSVEDLNQVFNAYTESTAEVLTDIQSIQSSHTTDIEDLNTRINTVEETATSNLAEAKAYADGKVADFERAIQVSIGSGEDDYTFIDGVYIDAGMGGFFVNTTDVYFSGSKAATESYVNGKVQEVQNAVDAIDVGVTKIVAGNDIVVTPAEGTGEVTVAHETFTTGTYQKSPEASDKTGDVYMMTSVTVDNGHVTGANVQSLAHALQAMSFIFDGGTSAE